MTGSRRPPLPPGPYLVVGLARSGAAAMRMLRSRGEVRPAETPEQAGQLLERLVQPGDRVLIKGSRSAGLERVLGERR